MEAIHEQEPPWNVDVFRDLVNLPAHKTRSVLSYLKRQCKAAQEAYDAVRGLEDVDRTKTDTIEAAFFEAQTVLAERRSYEAARYLQEMRAVSSMPVLYKGTSEKIETWAVEHFVTRNIPDVFNAYQKRELSIIIDEKA